nr:MAG: hypothetical protein DIU80_17740 [Chloroflexota bacterium]
MGPGNAAGVLRVFEPVPGMPLGVGLAGALSGTLPLDTIAAEIERSADFLAFDWRDAPERQRSMRAVFDWSWQLLTEAERQVYRRLAVFRGGWTYQAAQVVAGATLRVLTGLVHKSLLRSSRGHAGAGRYEMHELLRQFAAEQLEAAPDELAMAEERHSRCYLAFVVEREQRMARGEPREATDELRGEIDNIRKAWGWAARQRAIEDLDASAYTLWQFYTFSGLIAEGERAFQLAAEQLGAHEPAPPPGSQRVLSKLLAIRASLLISQSKHDQALALAEQALALAQASGSVEGGARHPRPRPGAPPERAESRGARPVRAGDRVGAAPPDARCAERAPVRCRVAGARVAGVDRLQPAARLRRGQRLSRTGDAALPAAGEDARRADNAPQPGVARLPDAQLRGRPARHRAGAGHRP